MTVKTKRRLLLTVFFILPIVTAVCAIGWGRYSISVREIAACFFPGAFPGVEVTNNMVNIVFNIRVPRILLAILAGAGLSVSGAAFQGLFANPLATPDTLGVAAGASFGAVLGILLGLPSVGIQLMALIWGSVAVVIVFSVSRVKGISSLIMLILAGMVVGALFSALVSLVKYVADPQDVLPSITYWLLGTMSGVNMTRLALGTPLMIAGTILIFLLRWRLNALSLQEDEARSLGINVRLTRVLVIVAATAVTAAVISMCGLIGWVGLLIPHLSRMIFGSDNKYVIPSCIGLGALFMLIVDSIARSVMAAEIPVSILTSVIGAPFFIILLRRTGGVSS
ncbi:MAG: iron ABC transporter permease [Peptococcaceae bacterium]|jgi:iron complex transport system permease protein|nr:iron ABC transporter permease [Peptococcaceae bacterium]